MSREVSQGIIPDGEATRVVKCRYCGTDCWDIEARDGHEPICVQNPAGPNYWNRKALQAEQEAAAKR